MSAGMLRPGVSWQVAEVPVSLSRAQIAQLSRSIQCFAGFASMLATLVVNTVTLSVMRTLSEVWMADAGSNTDIREGMAQRLRRFSWLVMCRSHHRGRQFLSRCRCHSTRRAVWSHWGKT